MEWPKPLHIEANRLVAEEVIGKLSRVYRSMLPPYYDVEDIQQECWVYVLEAVKIYKAERASLKTFLYLYVVDRLNMLRRATVDRKVKCAKCFGGDINCKSCRKQRERNETKKKLASPAPLDGVSPSSLMTDDTIVLDEVVLNEFEELVNCKLPPAVRGDFLRMKDGAKVAQNKREKVREFLKGFINGETD